MRLFRPLAIVVGLFACGAGSFAGPARAAEPFTFQTILPLTGGAAFLGNQIVRNYTALADFLNKEGGIDGRKVVFRYHDDQTSPQQDVQIAGALIAERPPIILGSSIVALCNAMAPLMRNGPVMYCLSPSFEPARGSYTFAASSATRDQITTIMRYFRLKGWTRIALLNSTDATGQNADRHIRDLLAQEENKAVQVVRHEHFNPGDISASAQFARIKESGAQAMFAWTTGVAVATVFKGMIQVGLDIPVGTTNGNQNFAQIDQFKDFLPRQVVFGSALYPPHEGLVQLDPAVEKAQKAMNEALAAHGMKADIGTSCAWDAALIATEALRRLGSAATPLAVRDFIAGLTGFPGVNGMYDFRKYPETGLGPESVTVVTYDPAGQRWVWLSKPGGAPL